MSEEPKVAIITGASRGIGLGIAEALVERGDRVCITGRNVEPLAEAAAELGNGTIYVAGRAHDTAHQDEVVKTVLDFDGNALYFSRAPIPWVRDSAAHQIVRHMKHLGLYVFQRDALLDYPTLPQGELERIEQLEQLRWMENGYKIRVAEVEHDAVSVDVPEDVARVEKLLQN